MTKLLVSLYNRSGVSNLLGLEPRQSGSGPRFLQALDPEFLTEIIINHKRILIIEIDVYLLKN